MYVRRIGKVLMFSLIPLKFLGTMPIEIVLGPLTLYL